jgi:hypothetical protein
MKILVLPLAISMLSSPVFADDWKLRLFGVDDDMYVRMFNNTHEGTLISHTGFSSNNPYIDLNPFIDNGTNWILLELLNGPKGWTYGVDLTRNSESVVHDYCGFWNAFGCDNDKYYTGRVWEGVIRLDTSSSDVSYSWSFKYDNGLPKWAPPILPPPAIDPPTTGGVVPEPAIWGLLIAGFGLVGSALRQRRQAAA